MPLRNTHKPDLKLSTEQVGQVNVGQILADLLWAGFSWVRQRAERPKRQITQTSKKDTQHIFNAASATTTGLPDGPALSQRKRTSHYRLICVSHQNESCVVFTTVLDLTSHTGSEKEGGWRADWFWDQHYTFMWAAIKQHMSLKPFIQKHQN